MIDLEVARETMLLGAVLVPVGLLIFLVDSRGESGFRLWPQTEGEWLAYYFHTLSFTTISAVFGAAFFRVEVLGMVYIGACVWTLISAGLFWEFDRALCKGGLRWCAVSLLCVFLAPPG